MDRKIIIIFAFCLLLTPVFSQEKIDVKETFSDAEYFFSYEEYSEALYLYKKIYTLDTNNANINYKIGMSYLKIPWEEPKAIPYFERAVKNTTPKQKYKQKSYLETKAPWYAYFYLGNAYRLNNDLDKALEAYDIFQSIPGFENNYNLGIVNKEIEVCERAKIIRDKPIQIRETNLGNIINTPAANYNAVVSGDESIIVYVTSLQFYNAIFFSKKVDNKWSSPINITPQIASEDCYPTCLSYDGKELLLVKRTRTRSDIYVSKYNDGRWTKIQPLNENINSNRFESHACISTDGTTLYFTSNRRGGEGNLDIYKSTRDESRDWGPAVNIGPNINTPGNEETPFISNDGKILYFSSEGHLNMGGYDIFYSILQEDNTWTTPENIGYPINTTGDNLFYVPVKNGKIAYYSKINPEGFGNQDIYRVEILPDENIIENNKVVTIENELPEPGKNLVITIINIPNSDTVAVISLDNKTNQYSYSTFIENYELFFEGKEYKQREQDDTQRIIPSLDIDQNAGMISEKEIKNKLFIIRSIFFNFDDYSINKFAQKELERLYVVMNKNPSVVLEVAGHSDSIGRDEYNQILSEKRANSVVNFLVNKGISVDRFIVRGVGESKHIAINKDSDGTDNPDGRSYNQRVDINILKSDNKFIISENVFVPDHLKIKKN